MRWRAGVPIPHAGRYKEQKRRLMGKTLGPIKVFRSIVSLVYTAKSNGLGGHSKPLQSDKCIPFFYKFIVEHVTCECEMFR